MWRNYFLFLLVAVLSLGLLLTFSSLNLWLQDGGWYLNAAHGINRGWLPYLDFYFPHTGSFVHLIATLERVGCHGVVTHRLVQSLIALIAFVIVLSAIFKDSPKKAWLSLGLILLSPYYLIQFSQVRPYSIAFLLTIIVLFLLKNGMSRMGAFTLASLIHLRMSLLSYLFLSFICIKSIRSSIVFAAQSVFLAALLVFIGYESAMLSQLFSPIALPFAKYSAIQELFFQEHFPDFLSAFKRNIHFLTRVLLLSLPYIILRKFSSTKFVSDILFFGPLALHLIQIRPLDEYLCASYFPALLVVLLYISSKEIPYKTLIPALLVSSMLHFPLSYSRLSSQQQALHRIQELRDMIESKSIYTLNGYLRVQLQGLLTKNSLMAQFSYYPQLDTSTAISMKVMNSELLWSDLLASEAKVLHLRKQDRLTFESFNKRKFKETLQLIFVEESLSARGSVDEFYRINRQEMSPLSSADDD